MSKSFAYSAEERRSGTASFLTQQASHNQSAIGTARKAILPFWELIALFIFAKNNVWDGVLFDPAMLTAEAPACRHHRHARPATAFKKRIIDQRECGAKPFLF